MIKYKFLPEMVWFWAIFFTVMLIGLIIPLIFGLYPTLLSKFIVIFYIMPMLTISTIFYVFSLNDYPYKGLTILRHHLWLLFPVKRYVFDFTNIQMKKQTYKMMYEISKILDDMGYNRMVKYATVSANIFQLDSIIELKKHLAIDCIIHLDKFILRYKGDAVKIRLKM